MRIIAHRAITDVTTDRENHPDQHKACWGIGFDTEADLWVVDGRAVLGHDKPEYEVPPEFLENNPKMWVHCKNFAALQLCMGLHVVRYFWHQNDDFTLTNQNYIWTYPKANLSLGLHSIPVILQPWEVLDDDHRLFRIEDVRRCYGICTDSPWFFAGLLHE